jgi:hypothetical protein
MEDSPDIAAAIQETTARLPDTRLTNIYATRADVLEDIAELYPLLSPSRPEIAAFMQLLDNQPRTKQHFPVFERQPKDWVSTTPEMDAWFRKKLKNRPTLTQELEVFSDRTEH